MSFLPSRYDPTMVVASVLIGSFASYVALDLAKRAAMRGRVAVVWWACGIRILIDDFGTGYSSLNYIKQMPIDSLKIDRSFARNMSTDPRDTAIIRAIMSIAHSLGMSVIAEGVESSQQAKQLVELGCVAAQGYYYHRPMTAAACSSLLSQINQQQTWEPPSRS